MSPAMRQTAYRDVRVVPTLCRGQHVIVLLTQVALGSDSLAIRAPHAWHSLTMR
jgi:hypothetical protein